MASVKEIKTALASQLETYTGLTVKSRMPDQINPPMAVILPGTPYVKYGITMGEHLLGHLHAVPVPAELNLVVAVFVSRAPSLERAQDQVDLYLGLEPSDSVMSIPLAIFQDTTLGHIVEYCEPLQVQGYGDIEIAGQTYFQGRIVVSISATQD